MPPSDPSTLFSPSPLLHPPSAPTPTSSVRHRHPFALRPSHGPRHAHLLRLYNLLLHLLSLPPSPQTTRRTVRAWRALAACREVELEGLWAVGAKVLDRLEGEADGEEVGERRVEWLRSCQDNLVDREGKFVEVVLALISVGRAREALDELDGFLPSRPYHDSIALHVLAGTLTLYLSQPRRSHDDDDSDLDNQPKSNRAPTNQPTTRTKQSSPSPSSIEANRPDLIPFLHTLASASPSQFGQAKEYFRRAAELEGEHELQGRGEGKRWFELLESVEVDGRRERSRSMSP